MQDFPNIYRESWGQDVTFIAEDDVTKAPPGPPVFSLVHAFVGDLVLLADIVGRGWCIPSGRLEPGETAIDAAVRETYEETGGRIGAADCKLFGYHRFIPRSGDAAGTARYAAAFVAQVGHFDAIPAGSESRGLTTIPTTDVAAHYFLWDELMAVVFAYAETERIRLLAL